MRFLVFQSAEEAPCANTFASIGVRRSALFMATEVIVSGRLGGRVEPE
jgi:hypothetical protein